MRTYEEGKERNGKLKMAKMAKMAIIISKETQYHSHSSLIIADVSFIGRCVFRTSCRSGVCVSNLIRGPRFRIQRVRVDTSGDTSGDIPGDIPGDTPRRYSRIGGAPPRFMRDTLELTRRH